VWRVRWPLPY